MSDFEGRRCFVLCGEDTQFGIEEAQNLPQTFNSILQGNFDWNTLFPNVPTTPPNFNIRFAHPIKNAKVVPLSSGISEHIQTSNRYHPNQKPVYVRADIKDKDLGKGEGTSVFQNLARAIRARGRQGDDCGHIIANSFGGKMIDFNLFPQDKRINRGLGRWSRMWRLETEAMVPFWLKTQILHNPMVRMHFLLRYEDTTKPDRPSNIDFCFEFFKSDGDSSSDEDSDNETEREEQPNTFAVTGEVANEAFNVSTAEAEIVKEEILQYIAMMRELRGSCRSSDLKDFLGLFSDTLEEIVETIPVHQPEPLSNTNPTPTASSSRGFSFWDCVPVVGSIRSIGDAIDCGKEGNVKASILHGVLGVGGLALDVVTLGAAGAAITGATKTAVKVGAQGAIKSLAKGAAIGAAKSVAIGVGVGTTAGFVFGGVDGALTGAVRGALGGVLVGGLRGGAQGVTKAAVKTMTAETLKRAAAESAKAAAEEAAKSAASEAAKAAAADAAKSAASEAAKAAAAEAAQAAAAEASKALAKAVAIELSNQVAKQAMKEVLVSEMIRLASIVK